jgi:hypothetical protein
MEQYKKKNGGVSLLFLGVLVLALGLIWIVESAAGLTDEIHLGGVFIVGLGVYLVLRWKYGSRCCT